MSNSKEVRLFSLGIEELALSLGIINRADMGRELLSSIYDNLSEDQIDARLSSASHSLLARGLVAITKSGSPTLESRLEQALFPVVRFDSLLQLSLVKDDTQTGSTIHIQRNKAFTSHSIQAGVVHVLEHGSYNILSKFIQDVFSEANIKGNASEVLNWIITPGVLGQAIRMDGNQKQILDLLQRHNLPERDAQRLSEDLANQKLRGTILKSKAHHSLSTDELRSMPKEMLMFLQGSKRTWVFSFSSTEDNVEGKAQNVDKSTLDEIIASFISA